MQQNWITGAVVGVVAPLLVLAGNPANMGLCLGCFLRDTAGADGVLVPRAGVPPESESRFSRRRSAPNSDAC